MKLTLKQIRRVIIALILVIVIFSLGYFFGSQQQKNNNIVSSYKLINKNVPQEKDLDFSLFWEVWDKLSEKYYDQSKVDKEKMFYGAIQGLTQSLGDPYTVFLPPKENQEAKEDLNGSFEGVGMSLGFNKEKRLIVISPLKGSPAEEAGVRAGDLILHIKDEEKKLDIDTYNLTLDEAVEKIRGPKGSKVILTMLHDGEEEKYIVEIERKTIIVPSVEVEFLDDQKIAHLKLSRFGDLTPKQWDEAVEKILEKNNLQGIILDVRGNPGGYLSEAINLASEFISKGVIVKQEDYKGEVETYSVNRRGRLLETPLVVLIDKGSASASEILAGALQDHKRAKVVGVESFGKGTIQEAEDIATNIGLHITTAKWLTPNGVWVDQKGLKPDFVIENDPKESKNDKQLLKAKELLL